jgi:glycosyltransferase 2 family protein
MAVMSMVTLVTVLPISLAGWGVREVSVVALLGMLGVDQAPALLLSVEFGLLGLLMTLPGGLLWLFVRGRQPLSNPARPNLATLPGSVKSACSSRSLG